MRVDRIRCYRQSQPFAAGTYATSSGSATGFDSLIVAVDTEEGVTGWGEMAPLGAFYDSAFSAGARAAADVLSEAVLGVDPRQHGLVTARLDRALRGHPYAKSAFDMACWDASAQATAQPLCEALGGRFGERVALYRSIAPGPAEEMATMASQYVTAGYRRLQVKVGGDPLIDADRLAAVRDAVGADVVLFADANGGWTTGRALTFLDATRSHSYTLEQPCATLEECAAVRNHCPHPLVLDESIDSVRALSHAASQRVCDGVTVKIARVGGVTRAARIRDLAVELGLEVTVEDTGGASIDTAAMLHLSLSTPEAARLHTVDFNAWVTVDNADGIPPTTAGELAAPDGSGLGIVVREAALGNPFHVATA
jgi:L-alanine-DL-glutamate epimerase-like enolase superfamily enzyme